MNHHMQENPEPLHRNRMINTLNIYVLYAGRHLQVIVIQKQWCYYLTQTCSTIGSNC